MMIPFCRLALAALCAGALASCYYPGYDSYNGGYGGGYADTYGISGGGTAFVHTSSNQWFYDTSVRCYYDRNRQCYYDPWLNGYYPRGYCPKPVTHVPHPYGWNGRGSCPVPRKVNHRQIDRYKDRTALLRAKTHAWARNVKEKHNATARKWQEQRARQAAQFANNRNQPSRSGGGMTRPSPFQPTVGSRQPDRNRQGQASTRPSSSANQPIRPPAQPRSAQPRSRNTPQASPSPRRPSTPPSNASRPGYNQPVSARPTRSQTTSRQQAASQSTTKRSASATPQSSRSRGGSTDFPANLRNSRSRSR